MTRAADLAICEMETPLAPAQGPFTGYPTFSAPPQVLAALRGAGYDSCTTASNHTIDEGYEGLKRTLDDLDTAGLKHTGSARTAAEAARPLIITMPNGAKVAQLAYAFSFNGLTRPAGAEWEANLTDVPTILAAAHRAKHAGADIVVLSMHWGIEYNHGVTAEQESQARALLASPDIDLILGDHAHAVEPFERINGKWVVFCMGDQISRHAVVRDDDREGVMPRFTFTEVAPHRWRVSSAEAIPTWIDVAPKDPDRRRAGRARRAYDTRCSARDLPGRAPAHQGIPGRARRRAGRPHRPLGSLTGRKGMAILLMRSGD